MRFKIILALIALALGAGFVLVKTKGKPPASFSSAEKKIEGIPRPTDKDHNPSEYFHVARTPAEKALDEIIRRDGKDENIFHYVLGTPWYDAKKDTGYSRLFTKKFVQAVTKMESDLVKADCGGKYLEGELCGIDYSPITCAQDHSESGYLYRTVEDDGRNARILFIWVDDVAPNEIETSHRLVKDGDDWKLDGVNCGGGGLNVDCSNSLCADDMPDLLKKAEQGDAEAQFSLAVMYKIGWGVQWDENESAKWYRKAAEQGHLHALVYAPSKNDDEDLKWLRSAAEQGHVIAQYYLGDRYEEGRMIEKQDHAEAVKWYKKAAEQGYVHAQFSLGTIYEHGREGVEQDYAEAAKWYGKAAEQGEASAQYQLGMMYEDGRGVKKNDAEAAKWYREAAERGYAKAKQELARRELVRRELENSRPR